MGLKVASEPDRILYATHNIDVMQAMIQKLLDNGHAYIGPDKVVYYSVESFPRYGELSGNTLEMLREGSGGRVNEENQSNKRHPADFLLWKPDTTHLMRWPSPWGEGYPGWHIECSAMARKRLERDVIDIHTGGEDLIFPHHECEIAQSCGASDADEFARFWIHARFLLVEGEKMSKSKGNFFTVRDVLEGRATGREVHPAVLRFELTKSHYRTNMNFTTKGLQDSARTIRKLTEFTAACQEAAGGEAAEIDNTQPMLAEFLEALADDLNVAGALGVLLPWAGGKPANPQEALAVMQRVDDVLGLSLFEPSGQAENGDDANVAQWCADLDAARAAKDYGRADDLRKQIIDAGYEVRTTKEGTVAKKTLV